MNDGPYMNYLVINDTEIGSFGNSKKTGLIRGVP